MKKFLSLILVVAMSFFLAIIADAEDTYQLTVPDRLSIMVNNAAVTGTVTVTGSDKIKIVDEDEHVIVSANGKYYDVNTVFYLSEDADFTDAALLALGLDMVEGAQVRVGQVELSNDGRIDATADSGLRFIATADYSDTVIADESIEFGIKVVAEGNDNPVYVKAEKFQNDERSVFSAAITNLSESNYNRKYTACAYVLIPMHDGTEKEVVTASVTRSIYQVSVGILKNSSAEAESDLPYTIDDAVKSVLGAYINQTGIRLTYTADGSMSARTTGKGAYTGDLFFAVTSSVNEDGSTHVVITPYGATESFYNKVEIASWWKEYVRINNNNTVAAQYISDAKIENGVLSFTFTLPDTVEYTFDQEDNVTIVKSIENGYITGIKAGEEVTYSLADAVTVMGLAESMEDIVPGCVIMVGYNKNEDVAAIELLASLGLPINPESFEADFGVYDASDGSTKYKNVVTEMYSKSGSKITAQNLPDTTKTAYRFESSSSMCYRVGIAMSGDTPVITATGSKITTYPSIFENTSKYHNYLYFRYNSETERVKECVFYCVPKDLDFSGDGEYSDIFSLDDYVVIIE
ncbi:MAG: hypothetical protein IJ435_06920 [Clostridia bacterium]|nr:hypothetical protein [Clostridia bacterium]